MVTSCAPSSRAMAAIQMSLVGNGVPLPLELADQHAVALGGVPGHRGDGDAGPMEEFVQFSGIDARTRPHAKTGEQLAKDNARNGYLVRGLDEVDHIGVAALERGICVGVQADPHRSHISSSI